MRRGTKIGWALVAFSILLSVWVIAGGSISNADEDTPDPAGESGTVEPIDGGLFDSGLDGYSETTDADGNTTFNFGDGTTGYYNAADGSMTYYDADGSYYIQYADGTGKQFDADGNEVELLGDQPSLYAAADETNVEIADGVTSIESQQYSSYTSLQSVSIPASVTDIKSNAFENCTSLTSISIDASNSKYYAGTDGVVYVKGTNKLWIVPEGATQITLNASTTEIDEEYLAGKLAQMTTREVNPLKLYVPRNVSDSLQEKMTLYGISFVVLDDPVTPVDPTPTPPSGGGGAVAGGGVPVIPSNGTTPATTNGTTTDATTADGSANTSASAATGTTHDKDATPTTADGDIDPRYILVLAVFLAGIGMIIYGQQGKYKYMTENRRK